ncbi:phage tail assembly chaperone [Lactococcus lactis]|uniref:phage tail assembly chaperone n=1 Tax=Lactococcus lactis TaxID=1358 RepID=UPI0022E4D41B|nr:phage tail assembly chaperone [Lactococcus lactis]MDA2886560.1 phage tail assembly chaperone [Lactococcus lactis]MDA2889089.1 phage tail assembly chaperone [Lactococcus lactis]MDA2908006.1 phage tail assembly chaperone [Lactococcus lactis]
MKLSLPEIREESFEVKTSIKNIKKMHAYQLELAKSQEKLASVQDGTLEELTKAIALDDMSVINNAEKFITEILGLNKKEIDKLEEFDRGQFMNLQSKLVLSLQGYDDDQIDTMFTEEVDSAEKKVQALKNEKSTTTTN